MFIINQHAATFAFQQEEQPSCERFRLIMPQKYRQRTLGTDGFYIPGVQ